MTLRVGSANESHHSVSQDNGRYYWAPSQTTGAITLRWPRQLELSLGENPPLMKNILNSSHSRPFECKTCDYAKKRGVISHAWVPLSSLLKRQI